MKRKVPEDRAFSETQMDALEDQPANLSSEKTRAENDWSERQQIEAALMASEVRYRRLFETAKDGILLLDADTGQIDDVNPFLQVLLGYSHAELLGRTLWEIGPFKDIAASQSAFRQLQSQEYVRYENLPLETKSGQRRQVEFVSNVYLVDGRRVIQCNIRDITARKQTEAEIRKTNEELVALVAELKKRDQEMQLLNRMNDLLQAIHDPLTGLYNRRYLEDSLARELYRAKRRNTSLCVSMLDIDHFKYINDTFGNAAGDALLRELGRILRERLRMSDIACRYGGDEFVLILPDSSLEDTCHRVQQILALVKELRIWHDDQLLESLIVSAGVAVAYEHNFNGREILQAADEALFAAKQAGRNLVVTNLLED
jgi:diguanylate cyclase (GGDEF)-like protein/PAS domain S-box-containing protein